MIQEHNGAPNAERNAEASPDDRPSWPEVCGLASGATIEKRSQQRHTKRDQRRQQGFHQHPLRDVSRQEHVALIQRDEHGADDRSREEGLTHDRWLSDEP